MSHALSNRADLSKRTETMSCHGDRQGRIADFRSRFETIKWLCFLCEYEIKTKTHFEWVLKPWTNVELSIVRYIGIPMRIIT